MTADLYYLFKSLGRRNIDMKVCALMFTLIIALIDWTSRSPSLPKWSTPTLLTKILMSSWTESRSSFSIWAEVSVSRLEKLNISTLVWTPDASLIWMAASFVFLRSRPISTMLKPSEASCRQYYFPRPSEAPVTTAQEPLPYRAAKFFLGSTKYFMRDHVLLRVVKATE